MPRDSSPAPEQDQTSESDADARPSWSLDGLTLGEQLEVRRRRIDELREREQPRAAPVQKPRGTTPRHRPQPQTRRRGAGRPRPQASRNSTRASDSGDSDDGPGEPPAATLTSEGWSR